MTDIYAYMNISRQGVSKKKKHQARRSVDEEILVKKMLKIREKHPIIGLRKLYEILKNESPVGRDKFIQIAITYGFRRRMRRNRFKTTFGQSKKVYPNLIDGLTINGINQVWQSDIFYYKQGGHDYFGVCIQDVYSRKLLALHMSKSLKAEENLIALKHAIASRKGMDLSGCIFHSDRGSQYISDAHENMVLEAQMQPSMCKIPQQNAYVERLNGIVKNEYLYPTQSQRKSVKEKARKIMHLYNNERPHESLGMLTPTAFEHLLKKLGDNQGPEMLIYQWKSSLSTEYQVVNKEKRSKKESLPNT